MCLAAKPKITEPSGLRQVKTGDTMLSGGGVQQLLVAVLNLRLDPVCTLLTTDLEVWFISSCFIFFE